MVGCYGVIEKAGQGQKKIPLSGIMQVCLLDATAGASNRLINTTGSIGAKLTSWGTLVLENFSFPEVGKFLITAVFENQRFAAVAHDNPIAMADFQFLQRASMFDSSAAPEQLRGRRALWTRRSRSN